MNKRQRQIAKIRKYPFKKPEQVWNADISFAKYIYGGLCQYRRLDLTGYPDEAGSFEKWLEIVDEMIWTFREIYLWYPGSPYSLAWDRMYKAHPELAELRHTERTEDGLRRTVWNNRKLNEEVFTPDVEAAEAAYRKRIEDGLHLFAKYFEALWD